MSNLHSSTQIAIQYFEEAERARLLLDRKEVSLTLAVMMMSTNAPAEDKVAYAEATEEILAKYEAKREKDPLLRRVP